MKILLSLILLFTTGIFSQDIPSTSKGDLRFYVDFASFKGDKGKTYQEFYLMIHADELKFISNENISAGMQDKNASFKVTSVIRNQNEIISEQEWFTHALLRRDSIDLKNLVVYDQWAEILDPGYYNISVNVVEQEHKISGDASFKIKVPSFNDDELSASSIEFISRVEEKKEENHFEKNGRIIIPNPWRRYGLLIPKLSFYYEVYNIANPADDKSLTIDYSIINNENKKVKSLQNVELKKSGKNKSIVHAIDIDGLISGIYTLTIEINDPETNKKCFQSRSFEIIQIDYLTKNPQLTEEEAETGGMLLEYFASPGEFDIYKSLTLQGKTNFLISFWKERDIFPETPENEFLQDVMQRHNYANEHFGWGNKAGYKTDKGRVLIKYGMPDEINSFYSESNTSPYEIWKYTHDREFIFVFGDVYSNGNFVLLHSTKEGEVSDYSWRDYLRAF